MHRNSLNSLQFVTQVWTKTKLVFETI